MVVIGRNEEKKLPALIESLQKVKALEDLDVETIFVDSASSDNSVDVANGFFDKVIVLRDSRSLCAAAGRNIGTLKAEKDWILYLDGDMEVYDEFIELLPSLVADCSRKFGYLGKNVYIFGDGSVRYDALGVKNTYVLDGSTYVEHFGGAVLLPRSRVLEAGNYNASVFSNEEIDLHTRLKGVGVFVKFVDVPMISHHTEFVSKWQKLIGSFVPTSIFGRKFYGFGQLLASRVKNRQLLNFMRYFPYPFVFWGGLVIAVALWALGLEYGAAGVLIASVIYVCVAKGPQFIALYIGFASQTLFGWSKYDGSYKPEIRAEYLNGLKLVK